MRIPIGVLAVLTCCSLGALPLHAQSSPEGAWTVVEVWGENPDDGEWRYDDELQPSLFLFVDGHYSIAYVGGLEPRPLMPEGSTRSGLTPEQATSVWVRYTSNSGTYELEGSTLVTRPLVALWPNFMQPGSQRSYDVEWDGGDLLLKTGDDDAWYVWRLRRTGQP